MVDTQRIGDTLRHRREALGLSIYDAAETIKILPRYLEALEDDQFDQLPNATYAWLFLRTYASHLDLNVNQIREVFEARQRPVAAPLLPPPPPRVHVSWPSVMKWVGLAAAGGGIVVLFAWVMATRPGAMPRRHSVEHRPTPNPAPQEPANPVRESPEGGRVSAPPVDPTPGRQVSQLIVKVKATTFVEVTIDRDVRKRFSMPTMLPGEVRQWEAHTVFHLWVGDSTAVDVLLNGVALTLRGRANEPFHRADIYPDGRIELVVPFPHLSPP